MSSKRAYLALVGVAVGMLAFAAPSRSQEQSDNGAAKPAASAAATTPKAKPEAPAAAVAKPAAAAASAKKKPAPAVADAGKIKPVTTLAPATAAGGHVIVMRGLANIWSRGMDVVAKKFSEQGVQVTLVNHTNWKKLAAGLIEAYKADKKTAAPIILIGHSLGGDASLVMSNWLGLNGVPVRLVVVFDAVAETHPVLGTVQEVLNYYKPKGYGQEVRPGKGFTGTITNIDLTKRSDITHINIDKIEILQDEVMAKVMEILKVKPKVTATSG